MSTFLHHSRRFGRGFTVIELMVVVSIITVITAVLLVQNAQFNSTTLLRSLAYSVALSIRQAQVYGSSVRQFEVSSTFNADYGIHFRSADLSHYTLFADIPTKDHLPEAMGTEDVEVFSLGSGYIVKDFCGIVSPSVRDCSSGGGGGPQISWLTVYFERPEQDAKFVSSQAGTYTGVYIQLEAPGGKTRSVTVTSAGQIIVGAPGS